jgi:transposase
MEEGQIGGGAHGETIVFGIYGRNRKVYKEVVKNCSSGMLQAKIKTKVNKDGTIYSDEWRAYSALVDLG